MDTKPTAVATAFIAAINRHALPDLFDLMTEDHTFVDSLGQSHAGRDTMMAGWKAYFAAFPDYEIRIERVLADGEVVAIFGSASGTFAGKRGPVPENRIVMPAAWKAVIDGGRVRLWQVYSDWTEGMRIIQRESGG